MKTLKETLDFMCGAHDGQTDKGGNPYWMHPVAVMNRLGPNASDTERMVALLHDVIEDTKYTEQDLIDMGWSTDVVNAVRLLSRPDGDNRPTYMEWIRSIAASGNRMAIKVKIADNEENSDPKRIAQLPPEGRDIVKRYERSLKILRAAL